MTHAHEAKNQDASRKWHSLSFPPSPPSPRSWDHQCGPWGVGLSGSFCPLIQTHVHRHRANQASPVRVITWGSGQLALGASFLASPEGRGRGGGWESRGLGWASGRQNPGPQGLDGCLEWLCDCGLSPALCHRRAGGRCEGVTRPAFLGVGTLLLRRCSLDVGEQASRVGVHFRTFQKKNLEIGHWICDFMHVFLPWTRPKKTQK